MSTDHLPIGPPPGCEGHNLLLNHLTGFQDTWELQNQLEFKIPNPNRQTDSVSHYLTIISKDNTKHGEQIAELLWNYKIN